MTHFLNNFKATNLSINDISSDHQYIFGVSELTADRTVTLPLLTGNDEFTCNAHTQTLTNKTINADSNTITNIDNADIKGAAAIDATKIADGTVTSTEFQYINTLSSNAQTQLNAKAASSHAHSAADITTGTLAVARGGTGAVTAQASFDALGPGTAKGDVIIYDGFNHARIAVGADGQFLVAASGNDNGLGWSAINSGETNTASSAGGTSLYKTKTSSNLIFKGLTATSTKIGLTSNTNDVGVDVVEGNLTLANMIGAPTGAVLGTTDTQTLTNKTATSTTNNITAKGLHSATTTVSVSAATAPTTGQVLTATSGTVATWQTPSGGGLPTCIEISATTTTSTTSNTYITLNSMTSTPAAATYKVDFSCTCHISAKDSTGYFAIYKAGTIIASSARQSHNISGHVHDMNNNISSMSKITVNGSDVIDIRYHTTASSELIVFERTLILTEVSA